MSSLSSVSSSSSSSFLYEIQNEKMKEKKQKWDDLSSAIESGDLEAAQAAFTAIQSDLPKTATTTETSTDSNTGQSTDSGGKLGADMKALADALESGDLTTAATALDTLKSDMKSQRAQGPQGPQGGQRPPPPPQSDESEDSTDTETTLLESLTNTSTDEASTSLSMLIAYLSNGSATDDTSTGQNYNAQA